MDDEESFSRLWKKELEILKYRKSKLESCIAECADQLEMTNGSPDEEIGSLVQMRDVLQKRLFTFTERQSILSHVFKEIKPEQSLPNKARNMLYKMQSTIDLLSAKSVVDQLVLTDDGWDDYQKLLRNESNDDNFFRKNWTRRDSLDLEMSVDDVPQFKTERAGSVAASVSAYSHAATQPGGNSADWRRNSRRLSGIRDRAPLRIAAATRRLSVQEALVIGQTPQILRDEFEKQAPSPEPQRRISDASVRFSVANSGKDSEVMVKRWGGSKSSTDEPTVKRLSTVISRGSSIRSEGSINDSVCASSRYVHSAVSDGTQLSCDTRFSVGNTAASDAGNSMVTSEKIVQRGVAKSAKRIHPLLKQTSMEPASPPQRRSLFSPDPAIPSSLIMCDGKLRNL